MTRDLQAYLLESIPIASHMQLKIADFSEAALAIHAPLKPNTNDKGTAFAGSLYSAMVLTGWTLISWRLKAEGIDAEVVVTNAAIQYEKPVMSDFVSTCRIPDHSEWDRFKAKLEKRKNYKIGLPVEVSVKGEPKARMNGEYVAWLKRSDPLDS